MSINKYEKCYECGTSDITFGELKLSLHVGEHVVEISSLGYTCKKCGEQWFWQRELMLSECKAALQVFSSNCKISYAEANFARKALGLKINDFTRKINAPDVVWDHEMTMLNVTPEIVSQITSLLNEKIEKLTIHDETNVSL